MCVISKEELARTHTKLFGQLPLERPRSFRYISLYYSVLFDVFLFFIAESDSKSRFQGSQIMAALETQYLLEDETSSFSSLTDETNSGISTLEAGYHVVCIVAGSGILQIPYCLSRGGWTSLILLFASAWVNYYTGCLIVKNLRYRGKNLGSYPK
jgi:hypothetical protein